MKLLDEIRELSDAWTARVPPQQGTETSKDIGKTVHVTSVVQPSFHEARGEEWKEELLNEVIIFSFLWAQKLFS